LNLIENASYKVNPEALPVIDNLGLGDLDPLRISGKTEKYDCSTRIPNIDDDYPAFIKVD
jgi:hypothetical protein